MIARIFTPEEKRAFFERAGFRVEKRVYSEEIRCTHGMYSEQEYEVLCVLVDGVWYKLYPLFEEVMNWQMKKMLMYSPKYERGWVVKQQLLEPSSRDLIVDREDEKI